jgi:hypothetical protein
MDAKEKKERAAVWGLWSYGLNQRGGKVVKVKLTPLEIPAGIISYGVKMMEGY